MSEVGHWGMGLDNWMGPDDARGWSDPAEASPQGKGRPWRQPVVLAKFLDTVAGTNLETILKKQPSLSLRQAYGEISPEKKDQIKQELGPSTLGKIFSLSEENHPEYFAKNLLGLARSLNDRHKTQHALSLLNTFDSQKQLHGMGAEADQLRLALMGRGSLGDRIDLTMGSFMDHLLDGPALLSMVAGGLSYRVFRALGATRFLKPGAGYSAMEYWGRRSLIHGSALLGESAVFTGSLKGLQSVWGREVDTSSSALALEYAGAVTLLGSLRFAGWGAGLLGKELMLRGWAGALTPKILENAGMFGGIVGSQHLQRFAGITEGPNETQWLEAIATLAHFKGAGYLLKLAPESIKRVERQLDRDALRLLSRRRASHWENLPQAAMNYDWDGGYGDKARVVHIKDLANDAIRQGMPLQEARPDIHEFIVGHARARSQTGEALRRLHHDLGEKIDFLDQVVETRIEDPVALRTGLERLDQMVHHSKSGEAKGSYMDWLTHLTLQKILDRGTSADLDALLRLVYDGAPQAHFERDLARFHRGESYALDLPQAHRRLLEARLPRRLRPLIPLVPEHIPLDRIPWGRLERLLAKVPKTEALRTKITDILKESTVDSPWKERIDRLQLGDEAKQVLHRWSRRPERPTDPENPLYLSEESLLAQIEKRQWDPYYLAHTERALLNAEKSPLALLRLKRLEMVLKAEGRLLDNRLEELADPELQIFGQKNPNRPPEGSILANSQWDGYSGDSNTREVTSRIYKELPDLLDPAKAQVRGEHRNQVLKDFLRDKGGVRRLSNQDVVEILERLGDTQSRHLAKAIRNELFELHLLEGRDFEDKQREIDPDFKPTQGYRSGYFYGATATRPKGIILIRVPLFALHSNKVAPDSLWQVLVSLIHEVDHWVNIRPNVKRNKSMRFSWEMSAHGNQWLYQARHGDLTHLKDLPVVDHQGFGMFFRNYFERHNYDEG